jgi:hypothetical protein
MAKLYSIYFQKSKPGSPVIDTKSQWGVVCKDFPFAVYGETKELPKRDWKDEDGEDTFIPDRLYMQIPHQYRRLAILMWNLHTREKWIQPMKR